VEKHCKTVYGSKWLAFGFRYAPKVTSNYRVPPAEILLGAKAE